LISNIEFDFWDRILILCLNKYSNIIMFIMTKKRHHGICEIRSINKSKVGAIKKMMLSDREVNSLSETFSVLADPTRTKIIYALSRGELCVCDIASILDMSISAVSHQLRILRNMRLVKFRKEAKTVYYSLDDEHINRLFNEGLRHVRE